VRQPEPTSLVRITSFNEENVKKFYDRISVAFSIRNMDEMGIATRETCSWKRG
jgi:hypothetical protein